MRRRPLGASAGVLAASALGASAGLAAARKAKGYTQKDLATRVDTSQTYISDLENCAINPSMLMLFRLTEVLEVEMATLFEGVQNE